MHLARRIVPDAAWPALRAALRAAVPAAWNEHDRLDLATVLYALITATPWDQVPPELARPARGYARFRAWRDAGDWDKVWQVYLASLRPAERVAWRRQLPRALYLRAGRHGRRARPRLPLPQPDMYIPAEHLAPNASNAVGDLLRASPGGP